MIKEKIQTHLKKALKSQQKERLSTLRMILNDIKKIEISK